MISQHIPKFFDGASIVESDTCTPLTEAVSRGEIETQALSNGQYPGIQLPKDALPGLCSVGFWNAKKKQSWGLDWHQNEGLELTFLKSGELDFSLKHAHHVLRPRDLTVTRPWQRHKVGNPYVQRGKLYWIILDLDVRRPNQSWQWPAWLTFTPADLLLLTKYLSQNEQVVWPTGAVMKDYWKSIGDLLVSPSRVGQMSLIGARINDVFCSLLEILDAGEVQLDEDLISARRTVELFLELLANEHREIQREWSIPEMAEQCGISNRKFRELCQEVTNLSPQEYLNRIRISSAKKLLVSETKLNVSEIAQLCGYSNAQYFATVFRNETGLPPLEFRKQNVS